MTEHKMKTIEYLLLHQCQFHRETFFFQFLLKPYDHSNQETNLFFVSPVVDKNLIKLHIENET